jgi:hypothetical protein
MITSVMPAVAHKRLKEVLVTALNLSVAKQQ